MAEIEHLAGRLRDGMHRFDAEELFENLHTYLHDSSEPNDQEVEHFHYNQELDKSLLSRGSVVGIGYGLMSPVLGMCTSMGIGLLNGGPLAIIGGFIIAGICVWFSALSLGEIVSKFPLELHVSSAMMAPRKLKLVCSWYTGWLILIGNWTMSTSITFAGAQLAISLVLIRNETLISEASIIWYTVIIFYLVVTLCGIVNLKLARFIGIVNKVCVYWIIYAIVFIDILLLLFHKGSFRSLWFAIFHFDNRPSGYSSAILSFVIALQQSNFTLQGFSMLPALADEVKVPERDIPRGMSISVLISTFSGVIFLLPIMLILPDNSDIFTTHKVLPVVNVFTRSTDSVVVSIFLILLILGNLFFSGISSITTSSRAVYSFSRDHALPRHDLWTFVKPDSQSKVPTYSILLSMGMSYLLGLLALFSTAAFNAFIGLAVICLCSGTLIPLVLVLLSRRRVIQNAAIKIRYKFGWFVNLTSIAWLTLSMVSVCFPSKVPVTFESMNYALIVYILCLISITILYLKWGRYNFRLPDAEHVQQYELINAHENSLEDQSPKITLSNVIKNEILSSSALDSTTENRHQENSDSYQVNNDFDHHNPSSNKDTMYEDGFHYEDATNGDNAEETLHNEIEVDLSDDKTRTQDI